MIKYALYKNGILLLETVNSPERSAPAMEEPDHVRDEERYDIEHHLRNATGEIKKIFYALQEKIIALPGVEERAEQKTGITYRTTKSFAYFKFGKTYIDIQLREPKYQDPKKTDEGYNTF